MSTFLANQVDALKRNTRENLLQQAEILFSQKGFYGTSINDVAAQVNVSKQGLLHHFPSKEKLYAAVLQSAADHLLAYIEQGKRSAQDPRQQLLTIFSQMSTASGQLLRVITLLLRELLDNRERVEKAHKWFMRPILDQLVAIADSAQEQGSIKPVSSLAMIYQMLGATQYYLISQPTLNQLYSVNECAQHQVAHLQLLESLFLNS